MHFGRILWRTDWTMATKRSTRARKNLGESGERVAAVHLQQRGYRIIERGFRTRGGEIDLVAQDADGLAFVEVRTRRGRTAGTPEESLTAQKRQKLLYVSNQYIASHPEYGDCAWRIDFVAIELDASGRIARIDLIKGAVEG